MRTLVAICCFLASTSLSAQITGQVTASPLQRGEEGTFSVVIENHAATPLEDVKTGLLIQSEGFSDDSSGQILEISGPGWRCEDPARRIRVRCRRHAIAPGERVRLSGRLAAPQSSHVSLFFHVVGSQPYAGGSVDGTFGVASGPADVDLSVVPAVVREPDPDRAAVSITATATNRSLQSANDVVLRLTGSERMPSRGASGPGWTCRVVSFDAICRRPSLGPGETARVTFRQYAVDTRNAAATLHLLFEGADAHREDNEISIESHAPDTPTPDPEDFEPFLLPIALTDTRGVHGSVWRTTFTLHNANDEPLMGTGAFDLAYPFESGCQFPLCPAPHTVPAHSSAELLIKQFGGAPGVLLWVRKDRPSVAFSLRIQDISRQASTWGTEIPVVRMKNLRTSTLRLIDVPLHPRFRQTLRIYDVSEHELPAVMVRIIDDQIGDVLHEEVLVLTTRRRSTVHEAYRGFRLFPAYAEIAYLAELPGLEDAGRVRVEIEPVLPAMNVWAFVSVTNNETQHVTLVTPQ